jgi:hypothetical protein
MSSQEKTATRLARNAAIVIWLLAGGPAFLCNQAEAQWANPYLEYGGAAMGGIGMSPWDQQMYKDQFYALNASRYNVANAEAVRAYEAANLANQQAQATAISNAERVAALQEKFESSPKFKAYQAANRYQGVDPMPLDQLLSSDGTILWPEVVLQTQDVSGRRAAADKAVKTLFTEARSTGTPSIRSINQARDRLVAFGRPALSRSMPRSAHVKLRQFLVNLDIVLEDMAKLPQTPASGTGQ